MKILVVLTSHDKLGNTGEKTGFWRKIQQKPSSPERVSIREPVLTSLTSQIL